MSDLKAITFLISFAIIFGGTMALIASEEHEGTEYETGALNYTEPSINPFNQVKGVVATISTGNDFIDSLIVSIFSALVVFLIYRAVRGQ